jgi:hypothetical protein
MRLATASLTVLVLTAPLLAQSFANERHLAPAPRPVAEDPLDAPLPPGYPTPATAASNGVDLDAPLPPGYGVDARRRLEVNDAPLRRGTGIARRSRVCFRRLPGTTVPRPVVDGEPRARRTVSGPSAQRRSRVPALPLRAHRASARRVA